MGSQEAIVNFYDRWILPPILDLAMRQNQLQKYRREVVAAAHGRVLEVGIGSGLNFPLYGRQVETVVGIDPSPRLLAIAPDGQTRPVSARNYCRGLRPQSRSRTAQ
jgi:SAM-dependent methyltransferase